MTQEKRNGVFYTETVIEQLKRNLPTIQATVPNLKKESSTSYCGPCFFCGGDDRGFVKKDGEERYICRHCQPKGMDVVDFHAKRLGTDIKGLARQYLNGSSSSGTETARTPGGVASLSPARQEEPPEPPDPALLRTWNDKCSSQALPAVKKFLGDARGLTDAVIEQIHKAGKVKTIYHAEKLSLAVAYTTLDGVLQVIQYFTIDGQPYPFTVKNGNPVNKIFNKGAKAGGECFFFCGAYLQMADRLIITEGVFDALTASECFPDACCIALGGSTYTKKLKALQSHLDHIEKIIVCGDNDTASEKMIKTIWKELIPGSARNNLFAITWEHDDPQGCDINDLLKAGQKERIFDKVQNADLITYDQKINNPDAWGDIVSMDNREAMQFDKTSFPGILGDIAGAISGANETPFAMAAGLILSVVATACQGRFEVEVKEGYREPLNLWVVVAMEPGNRKSSTINSCTKPLTRWENLKCIDMKDEIEHARVKRTLQESRLKSLKAKYGKAKPGKLAEIEEEIYKLEKELEPIPIVPQIWTQDVTTEHLGTLMGLHGEKMGIFSSEGGIFDTIGGRYSGGIPNMDLYLQGHAGDPVRVNRGSREPVDLEKPCLSLGLSPQPDVLKGIASKPGFMGRGLLARPLYLLPKSNLGHRTLDTIPVQESLYLQYEKIIHDLLDIVPPEDEKGKPSPYILRLTKDAFKEWSAFYHVTEKGLRDAGKFEFIRGWAGKLPGAAARIAGLIHCAKNTNQPWTISISLETMKNALDIASIFSNHALIVFDLMGEDKGMDDARKVWKWIQRNNYKTFKKRDCFNALKGTFPRMDKLEEPLKILVERSYVKEEKISTGGRPSNVCFVNPVFEGEK